MYEILLFQKSEQLDNGADRLSLLSDIGAVDAFQAGRIKKAVGNVESRTGIDGAGATGNHARGERLFIAGVFFV